MPALPTSFDDQVWTPDDVSRLNAGEYVEVGTWEDGERVSITDPFPIDFDLAYLHI